MGEKIIYRDIELDTALAKDIEHRIIIRERENSRTNEFAPGKMIDEILQILEDCINAY